MTTLRVAACQISSGKDPAENLRHITEAVEDAAAQGARVAVLPEGAMARFGADLAAVAQPMDGEFATAVRELANRLDVLVVVGMWEPADDGRVYNTLLATGRGVDSTYRKIHLYDAFGLRESDTVVPGDELVTVDVDGVRIGLSTCYDVRFAGQFTALGQTGAQVVVLPAAWADGPGKAEQWDLLVRARAMDSQAWFVACGQSWQKGDDGALGIGRSAVIDPLGVVRARLDHRPDVLVTDIDLDLVADVRERVPVLATTR